MWLQIPSIATRGRSLGETIVNAPIAGHSPRLNRIVSPRDAEVAVQGLVEVFGGFGSGRLHRAQLVRAARLEFAFFSVPLPLQAKARMCHRIGRRPKLGVLPAVASVGGYFHLANRAGAGPG